MRLCAPGLPACSRKFRITSGTANTRSVPSVWKSKPPKPFYHRRSPSRQHHPKRRTKRRTTNALTHRYPAGHVVAALRSVKRTEIRERPGLVEAVLERRPGRQRVALEPSVVRLYRVPSTDVRPHHGRSRCDCQLLRIKSKISYRDRSLMRLRRRRIQIYFTAGRRDVPHRVRRESEPRCEPPHYECRPHPRLVAFETQRFRNDFCSRGENHVSSKQLGKRSRHGMCKRHEVVTVRQSRRDLRCELLGK